MFSERERERVFSLNHLFKNVLIGAARLHLTKPPYQIVSKHTIPSPPLLSSLSTWGDESSKRREELGLQVRLVPAILTVYIIVIIILNDCV